MKLQFAFDGIIGNVLASHFQADCQAAVITTKFRLYYLIRPWLPIPFRQRLQQCRNSTLAHGEDWYIPKQFLSDLRDACQTLAENRAFESTDHVGSQRVIHPWPDDHPYAVSLTHDIETADGVSRVLALAEIEEKLGLRSAWYFVPHLYHLDMGLLEELKRRGHEVGVHGYNHDGRLFVAHSIFQRRVAPINAAGKRFQAHGFRAPMVHRNLQWMQAFQFDYDASCFDIDPFQPMPGGVGGVWPFMAGKLVELPYTLPQDHTLMITLGQSAYESWVAKLNLLKRLAGMAMLITHPDYLTTGDRINQYRRFCEHVASQPDNPWLCLPRDIAMWWRIRQASSIGNDGSVRGPASVRGRMVELTKLFQGLSND